MGERRGGEVTAEALKGLLSWAAAGLEVAAGQLGELMGEDWEEVPKQGLYEGAPNKWSKDKKIEDQNFKLKKRLKTRDIRLRTKDVRQRC